MKKQGYKAKRINSDDLLFLDGFIKPLAKDLHAAVSYVSKHGDILWASESASDVFAAETTIISSQMASAGTIAPDPGNQGLFLAFTER